MKTLWLVRHAKSSWKDASLDDVDRPLNARGKRDAPAMGARLADAGCKPAVVVTSPARRARATAKRIARALPGDRGDAVVDTRLYDGGVEGVLAVVRSLPDEADAALTVGHMPSLASAGYSLVGEALGDGALPTCAVLELILDVERWRDVDHGAVVSATLRVPKSDRPLVWPPPSEE